MSEGAFYFQNFRIIFYSNYFRITFPEPNNLTFELDSNIGDDNLRIVSTNTSIKISCPYVSDIDLVIEQQYIKIISTTEDLQITSVLIPQTLFNFLRSLLTGINQEYTSQFEIEYDMYDEFPANPRYINTANAASINLPPTNVVQNLPPRNIPRNAQNAITFDPIEEGNIMSNFHGEYNLGRFYKNSTAQRLTRNPYTRANIRPTNKTPYKAHIVGGKRRKTLKQKRKPIRYHK